MIGCMPSPEEAKRMLANKSTIKMKKGTFSDFEKARKLYDDAQELAQETGRDYRIVLQELADKRGFEVQHYDSDGNEIDINLLINDEKATIPEELQAVMDTLSQKNNKDSK